MIALRWLATTRAYWWALTLLFVGLMVAYGAVAAKAAWRGDWWVMLVALVVVPACALAAFATHKIAGGEAPARAGRHLPGEHPSPPASTEEAGS